MLRLELDLSPSRMRIASEPSSFLAGGGLCVAVKVDTGYHRTQLSSFARVSMTKFLKVDEV